MKTKQKLNPLVLAGSVLILFLLLFSLIAPAVASGDAISKAVQRIEGMKPSVQDLVDSNTLSQNHGKMLEDNLENAENSLNNYDKNEAILNLNIFTTTIKSILKKSTKLSSQHRDDLQAMVDTANSIINSLNNYGNGNGNINIVNTNGNININSNNGNGNTGDNNGNYNTGDNNGNINTNSNNGNGNTGDNNGDYND